MLRRSKAEVERYVASVQASAASLREKSLKGFQFAKLYFEVKEYELAKRYISTYLSVQKRDRRAHRFLGQIYEAEDNIEKAFGCYRRSVELNPMQKDLVLKIAELLCNNAVTDERAKYWVEKSAKLFPGSPAVYKLKEQLLDCKAPSLAELHKYDVDNTLPSHLGKSQSNSELQVARQNLQQHETKMSQLRETLRKMTDENNELRSSLNSLRENNELLKTQLLPMVTGQLQWMPFVDPKLHMSVIQFIYWSLRQIDTGSQDASMTATMERLAEVILKGAVQKGSMQKWTKKSTRSKPKAAHFFKSSSMPLRFLSTLVVLRTAKRSKFWFLLCLF
nr:uncharacterized protein LOC113841828 isoform X4 [Anas platyrhynchos]